MQAIWRWIGVVCYWLGWPAIWLYLHGSQRTRVLLVSDNKALVIKGWLGDGKWSLPGGGLHRGEPPEQGALRELAEETGIALHVKQLKFLMAESYHQHGHSFNIHYFSAGLNPAQLTRPQPLEIIETRWIELSQLNAKNSGSDVLRALELWKG